MFEGSSVDDLVAMLRNTVVRYDNKWTLVKEILDEKTIKVHFLKTREEDIVLLNDPLLCVDAPNIGYVNGNQTAVYCYRRPTRQYRQGIHREQLFFQNATSDKQETLRRYLYEWSEKSLIALLSHKYYSVDEAIKVIENEGYEAAAVSKAFAISKGGSVLYKGEEIGLIDFDTKFITLKRNKKYLSWLWELKNESV